MLEIAKKLTENIGQTVVVENKAGAGGNIAHQIVASGPSDGSMLLLGSIGPLTARSCASARSARSEPRLRAAAGAAGAATIAA